MYYVYTKRYQSTPDALAKKPRKAVKRTFQLKEDVRTHVKKAQAKGHDVRVVEVKHVVLLDTEFGPKEF